MPRKEKRTLFIGGHSYESVRFSEFRYMDPLEV